MTDQQVIRRHTPIGKGPVGIDPIGYDLLDLSNAPANQTKGANRTLLGWTATTTVFIAAVVLGIIMVALTSTAPTTIRASGTIRRSSGRSGSTAGTGGPSPSSPGRGGLARWFLGRGGGGGRSPVLGPGSTHPRNATCTRCLGERIISVKERDHGIQIHPAWHPRPAGRLTPG